jgi:hypothetical protein
MYFNSIIVKLSLLSYILLFVMRTIILKVGLFHVKVKVTNFVNKMKM